ncbi:MAG: ketopantoate reductase family protein [Rhodospirillaceae bacterium]
MGYRKICIVGPGAIGGMMAVMLKEAGAEVSALARPAKIAAIKANGLTLALKDRTVNARFPAASDPKELGPQDLVVVTLKSNALLSVAGNIAALCGPNTAVVFVMNGVPWWFFEGFGGPLAGRRLKALDPEGILAGTFPSERVVWSVVNCSVIERADGVIEHTRNQHLIFGRPDGSPRGLDEIAAAFQPGGYQTVISPNIRNDIWAKLVVNVSGNPISALTEALLGDMYDDPLVRECASAVADEARELGARLGLDRGVNPTDRMKDSPVRTSMLQDFERGRPLELAAIAEAVVEIGEAAGVPLPQTRAVLGLTRLRAAKAGIIS